MPGKILAVRVVGWGAEFWVAVLLFELLRSLQTGAAVDWTERAIFWGVIAPIWAFATDWVFRRFTLTGQRKAPPA